MPQAPFMGGVRIAGTGLGLPPEVLSNSDLESLMETSDEWIRQRTGVIERRRSDPYKKESATYLAAEALTNALKDASLEPSELDLIIIATVSMEMTCPSTACRVGDLIGAGTTGGYDLTAACCGFVFGMNSAYSLIRSGAYKTIGVVGVDVLSEFIEYNTHGRGTAIIFGDGAGAAVFTATDDATKGVIAQKMYGDGSKWRDLYIPRKERDYPETGHPQEHKNGLMIMHGKEVFRFAVKTFPQIIQETLDEAGLSSDDISMFICHQSNARILEAARERFGLPEEKLYVNIDRFGNTSAGSVPICLHELRTQGRLQEGELVMFVAFGGGLTWGSSLWRI
ncbi:MAG: beta-ketoacyl-ACP synthase III [Phycisphaerales bacterium JB043]